MDNLTLEGEPFAVLNLDQIEEERDYYNTYDVWDIFFEITDIGLRATSILSSVLLIYVISHFNSLKTCTNKWILHFAICSLLQHSLNIVDEILIKFGLYNMISLMPICIYINILEIIILLLFIFSAFLAIDWFVRLLNLINLLNFDHFQKYIIAGIYLVNIVIYILKIVSCFNHVYIIDNELTVIVYLVIMAIVAFINCFTIFRTCPKDCEKYRYSLTVSTYITLSWLPLLIFMFVTSNFVYHSSIIYKIIELVVYYLFKVIILTIPTGTAIWLYSVNADFQNIFASIFLKTKDENIQKILEENDQSRLLEYERNQDNSNIV